MSCTIDSVAQASAPASSASASASAAPAVAVAAVAAAAGADDMDDMFGGDDDVDEDGETAAEAAATVARQARMAAAKKLKDDKDAADGKTGAKKDKPVEKSLVVLEVKPWEADTDLEKVGKRKRTRKRDRVEILLDDYINTSSEHLLSIITVITLYTYMQHNRTK